MEGLVLFNKPQNYYSKNIVDYFKKMTNKKVGHGGTLDKLAQGLLIIGIGKATKYLSYFLKKTKKTYLAEIKFCYTSDTFDREGDLKKNNDCNVNYNNILEIIKEFKGPIQQKPPKFSAIKILGKKAYELLRMGISNFEIKPRNVFIYNYEIINYDESEKKLIIRLTVSSGFYVRSFANDLGQKLNCGAVLWNLTREKINNFTIDKALTFEDIENKFLEFKAYISGTVQGVGFRYYCLREAIKLDIKGYAKNLVNGRVKVLAQGNLDSLINFYEKLKKGPILAKVENIIIIWQKITNKYNKFVIL
ncbi:MAG: hypothetical protein KatS3mg095_0342 [Candidatus Parcubacteria bacterium]|nr:MAG: hypothetical protein KatS3mg095_0342 [Candidatus Parcubacteria bacterium]